jgi:hypothetical protein
MIGLPSTAATNDNFVCGVIMISSWSQNPGSSNYTGMIRYGITRFHFCPNPTLLRGVICWEEGVICRNWKTVHFQFRISRFSGMVRMTNHGHTRRTESNWAILFWFFDAGTMAFALFHTILATCLSHTSMSCMLFSRWFGGSRHQQYPTVVALESHLEIKLLGYDLIFQVHFLAQENCPGRFYFTGLSFCTLC